VTALITVEKPPAEPFEDVSFSVRNADLARRVPSDGGS
jgi:hypothetical protein